MNLSKQLMICSQCANIAREAHKGQTRRGGGDYYTEHVFPVAQSLARDGDLIAACVGYLHDVVEDTDITVEDLLAKGIPPAIAYTVALLTKQEGERYDEYIRNVCGSPIARKVKLADIINNLSANPTSNQLFKYGVALQILSEFNDE